MNICEICDKKFYGKQSWSTICPKCTKEISNYRKGLWKEKEPTAGQESKEQTAKKYYDYYRKKHKPRKCIICGKELKDVVGVISMHHFLFGQVLVEEKHIKFKES